MSYILSVGTAVPEHEVLQAEAAAFALRHFSGKLSRHSQLMGIFANTQIEKRHFVRPLPWFSEPDHPFRERNDIYIHTAEALSMKAAEQALARAGVVAQDIDYVVFVSTTGLATPSIDAKLIAKLGMKPTTKRAPIWGLGCAGGVAGLARAAEFTQAHPNAIALLVCVETCSITFQFHDFSKKNFVATALFADGAAAVVVAGDQTLEIGDWRLTAATQSSIRGNRSIPDHQSPLQFVGAHSYLFPNSEDVMGWDVVDTGLSVIFAPEIPARIARDMQPVVNDFMQQHRITPLELDHFVMHPGGARVIEAYQEAFGLQNGELRHTAGVLREFGNMSSPTVLFVLEKAMAEGKIKQDEWVLMGALGPGFSSELALLKGSLLSLPKGGTP
jgi:alkylresorcinol/alkylpyrone synthase